MNDDNYVNDKFTIDELIKRSWNLRNSDAFCKFFDFIAKFNHYSRYNTMLVYLQNDKVDFFGGSSYWKKNFNRTIRKDARPYIILAPMSPVMLVYDLMETDGKDSPEVFLEKGLGRKPFEVKGSLNPKIYHGALKIVNSWGIPTIFKPMSYFKAEHITTSIAGLLEICLKDEATIEQNFTVLLHELAHLLLGHTGHKAITQTNTDKKFILPKRAKITTTAEELEAEAVSYLISKKFGLETRSAEYMAGYFSKPEEVIQFSYETVIKVSDKIEKMFLEPIYKSRQKIESRQISLFE